MKTSLPAYTHHSFRPARIIIICLLTVSNLSAAFSQGYRVTGMITDKTDKQPVIGAYVYLSDANDSTQRVATTSDVNGKFTFTGLKKKSYRLTIQSINYQRETRVLTLKNQVTDLGTILLSVESKVLQAVVVTGQGTAVQKGDTTVMTADAFKVNVDANAEDLVKKMPGITVENGTVKARGEDVQQVLVDGRPFFGDDPSVALRNLPAEVIDRVQVYNRLSDQAELTGFDDGESSRTINIITKRSNRYSSFGKITGGTDFDSKYLVGGTLNVFSGPRRFTFSGMTNNINQQNFAMQDLIGSTSGGSSRGGWGGRSFGGWGGISKNSSLGFNYTDNWGKKAKVSGSYFYNTSSTTRITNRNTENLFIEDGKFETDSTYSFSENHNHRANLRIEYDIDTMNSLIIVPRFSLQNNNSSSQFDGIISGGSILTQTIEESMSDNLGYNLGNDITWRHKFAKKGRTLSVRNSVSFDKRRNDATDLATIDSVPDFQYTDGSTNNFTVNTNLNYTEPLGKQSQLQLNLNNRFRRSDDSREVFELLDNREVSRRLDSLSNIYDNDYVSNRAGMAYLYRTEKLNFSAGLNYERASLTGDQSFPQQAQVSETFQNLLPHMMLNYKFSDITNWRIFYRTGTDVPSISELQNAIDNSNRRRIRTGNPNLKQEYNHRIMSNFSYANPTTGFNTFIFMRAGYSRNIISSKTIYAESDTLIRPEGIDVTLYPGDKLTYPVNLDHEVSLYSMVNLSYFVKPIKSNVSFVVGGNYSRSPQYAQSPTYAESLINNQDSYSLLNSLIITSNISSNVDFTLSYTSNVSYRKNSLDFMENERYWYQSASAKFNLVFWKGIVLNTDVVGQYNTGTALADEYSETYFVWNASMGKKFLKNQAAEIRIGAYDILDQNRSISRSVSATEIVDTRTNAYRRYFLVLFTYNLRANRGQAQQEKPQQENRFPGGPPPGGFRPGGGPPGGYRGY